MQHVLRRRLQKYLPALKRVSIGLVLFSVIVGLLVFLRLGANYGLTPVQLWWLITSQSGSLKTHAGRTNLLLLGIGGANHAGGDLTDTLMVVSIDVKSRDTLMVAIPRDIWIPSLKDKINTAFHYGEEKREGGGLILAKAAVEEVVGLPIHYAFLIDFSGFREMIDLVGGIDVNVADGFTDPLYPIAGRENDECGGDPEYRCRYETITFAPGIEHMDGERALKYVRSRHAEGDAGTDFSRGKRQQAVLEALRKRLMQREILTDWSRLTRFIRAAQETVTTDMKAADTLLFARIAASVGQSRTVTLTQDEPEKGIVGLLVNPPLWQYGGKWVLIPKHGDFTKIGEYVACEITASSPCQPLLN